MPVDYEVSFPADGDVRIHLKGELAGERVSELLLSQLEEHYVDDGIRRIEADLRSVRLLDIEGVAALLLLLNESKQRDKEFYVTGARGQVREKLVLTGVLDPLTEGGGNPTSA